MTSSSATSPYFSFIHKEIHDSLLSRALLIHRMALLELHGSLLSRDQLLADVSSHYVSQAIDQAYVLLFGLEVLGNPYGLIKDFTQGLGDFFYEPFMVSSREVSGTSSTNRSW